MINRNVLLHPDRIRYEILSILVILMILPSHYGCLPENRSLYTTYYVSSKGSDNGPGTKRKPWKTIDRVNKATLKPGYKIMFEGGFLFKGTLRLDSLDKGTPGLPLIIGSYGRGNPIIDGGDSAGILITNSNHFIIKNLTVKGNGRKDGNTTDGMIISSAENFVIDSIEVSGFQHSGVYIADSRNARITHISAHDNGFAGIHVTSAKSNDPVEYGNEGIYIGYSKAFNNPGDPTVLNNHSGNGILASSVRHGTIEYCEAFNNGWDMPWTGNGPVGIWIWDCTGFTIQYCISHDNKTNPVAKDGGGFDFDGGVSNSVLQYCISYSNQGAGIGLFEFGASKPWQNNIVRFNISQNDGIINPGSLSVWKSDAGGTMLNCEIYNNTFYNDTAKGINLWVTSSMKGFVYENNIFVHSGRYLGKDQKLTNEVFHSNCFWKLSGMDTEKLENIHKEHQDIIFKNPLLAGPGRIRLTDPQQISFETLSGYSLMPGSPLIDKGVSKQQSDIINKIKTDIAGTTIPQGSCVDIGAIEFIRKK
jgi:hypothetical protein